MTLISRGFCSNSSFEDIDKHWQLFASNLDLLLNNEQKILNCADYFFCRPYFASCSWPYVGGDGQLYIGYLLLGWRGDVLTEHCPECNGKVLITSFAGSPLSGGNTWTGICWNCRQKAKSKESAAFRSWMDFVLKLKKTFPDKISKTEHYRSQEFDWKLGLKPKIKQRTIWLPVAQAVDFEFLIFELHSDVIRRYKPINVSLLKNGFELKLFSRT